MKICNPLLENVFEGNTVRNESIAFIDADEKKQLLFQPDKILNVTSYDGKTTYEEGKDYTFENGKIGLTEGSRIPYFTSELYYGGDMPYKAVKVMHNDEETFIYAGEELVRYKWHTNVTYTHSDEWKGFNQPSRKETYKRFITKLENGENVTVFFYGDSITVGCSAEYSLSDEGMHTYPMLFAEELADRYGYTVKYVNVSEYGGTQRVPKEDYVGVGGNGAKTLTYINTAVGGWGIRHGIDNFDTHVKKFANQYGCDLFVCAFGMNDPGNDPNDEKRAFKTLTDMVLSVVPDTHIAYISTMVPNEQLLGGWYGNQDQFEAPLSELAEEYRKNCVPCEVAQMTSVSKSVLKYKDFVDCAGNNINHPNNFLARLYTQTLLKLVFGY